MRLGVSRKRWLSIGVLAACLAVAQWVSGHVRWSESASLRERFFWTERLAPGEPIERWTYVVFPKAHPFVFEGKEKLYIKVVRCLPGDYLETRPDRSFWCNGEFLGIASETDSKGRPAPLFVFNGRIPEGRYFVLGEHPMSFDSKYWGFVRRDEILYRAKPLF
ncbi:MAG TPA: hypothetical protein ENJ62_01950 [Bryobacterales bacterium]|nr:hypothetical protein [Bryobacterales bacterium]